MPNLLLLERKAFTSLRRCSWLLPIATLTFVCQAAAGQQQLIDQSPDAGDAWAESRIAGAQAGYYHEQSTTTPGGKIATVIENDVVLNRLHNKVEMKSTAEYQETGNGQLLSVASSVSSSAQSIKTDARVEGSELVVRTSTGGKEYERRVPFTGVIVGPAGGRQLAARCLKNVGDTVSYQTFSPELGTMITIADAMIAKETITVEGIPTAAIKLEQTNSAMPGKSVVWLNADGWILRQVSPSPFGEMELMRASAENAQRRDIHGATLPKESFAQTLVGSNIRLPEERLIERLTIRITHKKPELGWPELNADNQRVVEQTADHVVLEIRQARPVADGARPVQTSDPKMLQYLQPNAILQSDDATVRSIAAHVVGNETDAYHAIRKLQEWTNQNMTFDPGIAIVPASEVARDRRGTCFGYAVLLASLARAVGIPTRIRMGFVYAGGIWGGHAWVDALIADKWVPLDAALYSPGPADAARLSFFTSSLQEGTVAQVGELAKLYGHVDVQVLDYTIRGKTTPVPPDAAAFSISQDTYTNPWLGLTVHKPKSFQFTQTTAIWPDSTIVAMKGPGGRLVEVESASESLPVNDEDAAEELFRKANLAGQVVKRQVAGHQLTVILPDDEAATVLRTGGNVFLVKAKGPGAEQLLSATVSGLTVRN